jgi:iron-sulfur cluster repair protein YtfE (RIC family)
VLHEEHFRILSLICGLENRVIGAEERRPIDPRDEDEKEHLQKLIVSLDQIIDHNAFEEAVLFPLICARGGGELTVAPDSRARDHRAAGEACAWVSMPTAGRSSKVPQPTSSPK